MVAEIFQIDQNHKLIDPKSSANAEEKKLEGKNHTKLYHNQIA